MRIARGIVGITLALSLAACGGRAIGDGEDPIDPPTQISALRCPVTIATMELDGRSPEVQSVRVGDPVSVSRSDGDWQAVRMSVEFEKPGGMLAVIAEWPEGMSPPTSVDLGDLPQRWTVWATVDLEGYPLGGGDRVVASTGRERLTGWLEFVGKNRMNACVQSTRLELSASASRK